MLKIARGPYGGMEFGELLTPGMPKNVCRTINPLRPTFFNYGVCFFFFENILKSTDLVTHSSLSAIRDMQT